MAKREDTLRKRVADSLDLPASAVAGTPRLEIIGFSELTLEPYGGIVQFTDTEITLKVAYGTVTIQGKSLTIRRMNQERITVGGQLQTVSMEGSGCSV